MTDRRFTVLRDQSRLPHAERATLPASLPWSAVEPWREQAEQNHDQTLERFNERGGLAPEELWCAAHGKSLSAIRDITESAAGEWLRAVSGRSVAEVEARQQREPS